MLSVNCAAARTGKQAGLERQGPRRNLLAEERARLQKQKLNGSSRAEGWGIEGWPCSKEALRRKNAGARSEECGLRRDPHRFEFPAKLERMIATDVSQVFRGLEMLLAVVVDAALDASRTKKVGNQDRGLKPRSHGIKMESSSPEIQHTFRSPMAAEHVEQVAVHRLVPHGVVAVEGWQALTRSGARYVLFAVVVEQVSNI